MISNAFTDKKQQLLAIHLYNFNSTVTSQYWKGQESSEMQPSADSLL